MLHIVARLTTKLFEKKSRWGILSGGRIQLADLEIAGGKSNTIHDISLSMIQYYENRL